MNCRFSISSGLFTFLSATFLLFQRFLVKNLTVFFQKYLKNCILNNIRFQNNETQKLLKEKLA